jgi:hypothetical protein
MMHSRVRSFSGVLTLALVAGACSDGPISPAAAPGAGLHDALSGASGQPVLIPNHVKYSDRGAKPATGRSGGATLTAYALQGKDGVTELMVTAGAAADSQAATLSKVQVKQFATSGDLLRTVNDNRRSGGASATYAYAGLSRGAALQVQGNVNTGARTGVVTVRETIHLRPDLRAALSAPEASLARTPVNLFATVTEANGDVGARADCVLYVNGAEAQRISGVWVDAGRTVGCAFTHTFSTPGPVEVRVDAGNVVPGDYDPANNTSTATIQIGEPENDSDFSYYAFVEDGVQEDVTIYRALHEYVSPDQTAADTVTHRATYNTQIANIIGWMSRGVTLPLTRVELLQQTGGATVHAATYVEMTGNEFPAVDGPDCVSRWSGKGFNFYLCTTPHYPYTYVQYHYSATQVTYVSEQHSHIWYNESGEHYYYNFQWGSGYQDGEAPFEIGDDYTFSIKITDGGQTWQTGARVVLAPETPWTWTHYPPTGEYCEVHSDGNLTWSPCWTHLGTVTRRVGTQSHYLE